MKILKSALLLAVAFILVQCQNEELTTSEVASNNQEIPQDVIKKLNFMGFNTDTHPVTTHGNNYVVEGDILISSKQLAEVTMDGKQRRDANLVSCRNIRDVRVFNNIGDDIPNADREFRAALRILNSRNSIVRVREERRESRADIEVRSVRFLPTNIYGQAGFPSNGKPFESVFLNIDRASDLSRSKWRSVIAHEIGHAIGLHHTDSSNGIFIEGTEATDTNSLMNSGSTLTFPTRLSRADEIALEKLYGRDRDERLCN